MEEPGMTDLLFLTFPQSWQGWTAIALLIAYVVLREKIHQILKRISQ